MRNVNGRLTVQLVEKGFVGEFLTQQVHLSFGNRPQVIHVQKFVMVFLMIVGQCLW